MSSRKKITPSNSPTANGFASQPGIQQQPPRHQPLPYKPQSTSQYHEQYQQPELVCTWSAHARPLGPSPSPFPRSSHALTATANSAGELFLFGGYAQGSARNDLHVFSTWDFSTTLLETSGDVPSPRTSHGAALAGNNLLVWGGITNFKDRNLPNHHQDGSLYILDLVSREWTRAVVNGSRPNGRPYHTTTVVGSKLFVFGGRTHDSVFNDMWALDLNSLNSQPFWESFEPAPWNKEPSPRSGHVSVATEDHIIIFGGTDDQRCFNDTWSFDIPTRTWAELQCTGSIPSPRSGHATVIVGGVMYVFGGFSADKAYLDDLFALHLSTLRWYNFHNAGPSPRGRSSHAMASDGSRVFVLGGYSGRARADEVSLIHTFDTKHIKFPGHEFNAINPSVKTTQPARWKSYAGPPIQEQPQHLTLSSDEEDICEGPTKYHVKLAAPPSEGEVARLEHEHFMRLERQLLMSLAAQTERDQRIVQLTDELELKTSLLEEAEANAAGTAKRAGLEDDLVEGLPPSRNQQIVQYEKKLANVRSKLEAKESELEQIRSRLTDAESGWTKSKAEADTLRAQIAAGLVGADEDRVVSRLTERMRAMIEAEIGSLRRNDLEKSREPESITITI